MLNRGHVRLDGGSVVLDQQLRHHLGTFRNEEILEPQSRSLEPDFLGVQPSTLDLLTPLSDLDAYQILGTTLLK